MKFSFILPVILFFAIANSSTAQTANPQQYQYVFTVAKDGSGEFRFIQDAIQAMRGYPLARITLYIKNGVYNEKIELPPNNTDVTFIGESVEKTIITFNDYSGRGKITTFSSYTARISGNRFRAENITFANTAGRVGQAVALYVDADQAVFINCRFLGDQDTILAAGENSRQLFENCYIEGTTDFIFGPATAVFRNCTIHGKTNSYITAANTLQWKPFGFLFLNCKVTVDSSVTKLYLGRPWRAYAKTAFINCTMPDAIAPEGWNNWNNPENEKTVLYAEFNNAGKGADLTKRVSWMKKLTSAEAKVYTLENIFAPTGQVDGSSSWFTDLQQIPFVWPDLKNR
jgi:pectinesterase